ncbi:transposase [Virgibacillus sp. DJP39]|uniref:transposase n=1 Tax=Virgibacillus sp. DJP39 TaxID=3409790 RepID=UPI003BB7F126
MDLQLELVPFHYYNTLGFDVELIDYIDHVDDSIVLEKIKPLYKGGGRPPADPRTYFRMHYLYFTMPEITSFRQLCNQLINPKNQAWRNFIGTPNIKDVPVHSSLSHFRKYVTPELFYEILFDLLGQALKLDDFLQPTLSGIDSRPVYAHVNGYKRKRCNCENKETCDCEKTFSDPDAKVGVQRNKANQNKFFIGYRKHSIVCPTPTGPVVLLSIILPPDTADIDVLLPLVEKLNQIGDIKVDYLAADLGYFSADDQVETLLEHDVAVVTDFKKNTVIPETCSPDGKPECEEGHALIWDGFDRETHTSWFNGDESKCMSCPLQASCDKQFGFSFEENPFFYGPVPQSTELQGRMLRYRKQVELAFAHESNQLDSVLRHKKVPVKTTKRVQSFFIMRDTFRLIERIIKHLRVTVLPEDHVEKIKELQMQQVEQVALPLAV